ncbi:MAG: hypothetical protein KA149_00395, partial [Chitinophagales bacterium]|nr:hypothetical protein [Chitinophagales bacterium]
MAKNNVFSISGKVSEINPAFGSDESLRFVGKEIEVWFCETLYEEFAGSVKTDSDNRFTLVVPAVNSVQKSRVVIFKVKDGEKYLRYTLNRSAGLDNPDLTAEIDYDNEIDVTLYIDFDSNYFTEFNHDTQVTYRLENTMHVPYSHRFVRGTLLYNSEVMQGLGTFKTNNYGYVKFAPAFSKQFYTGIKTEPERFDVLIELLDEHGESLHTASVSYAAITHPARRTTYVQVMFDVTQDPSAGSLPMAGVSATLGITLSPAVSGYFAANNINSLYDVRRIGGLRNQDALSGPEWDADKPTMDKLDGHAQFELLSKNYTVNTAAINGGYTSLHQVSRIGRSEFVTQLSAVPGVSKLDALTLHKAAYGTSAFLRNIVIERVQDARSVFAPTHYDTLQTVLDKIKEKCECDDCETGTSPFAYLADLLQYTTDHLSKSFTPLAGYSNGPVTIAGLEDIFLQPFGSMRTSCSEMKNYMCHYRLAIEILQSYRTIVGSGGACQEEAFIQAEKDFFKELYFALLNELGTDYEALREARGNTVLKQEIAESIGIVASYPGNSDTINTLTIDLSLIDPTDDVAFKAKLTLLENLFGFPSVYRDFNTTPGIPVPLITKWRKEWLRLNWLEQDFPQDEYNTRAKPLLDPDVVTVDDLSIAPEVSAADPVFNLWLKRRNFLDNKLGRDYFWNKNADDYWSPGVNKGTCTIELNYHAANDIAKGTVVTLVAKNSALGNQVSLDCIVASSVNSTSGPDITTITFLNNPAIPAGSDGYDLEYVESFDLTEIIIASASTNANSLIISGTALFAGAPALPTSGFGAGSYVEVTGAPPFVSGGSNNKKYKVGAYTAGTNIITIVSADPILTGNSGISMSDALLYARVKVAVTTLTQSTDMIPVDSAYAAEMDGRLMTIYNFDGTTNTFEADTNIPTVPSAGSWFDTKKTLHKTQGWYKMDYLLDGETWQEVGSNLSLGERTLIFNNLDLTGIDTYLAAATANSRLANGPEIVDKTINTVAFSSGLAKSLVKLDEFVPDSTNLSLVIEYPSIIISKTGSVVSFDLPDNGSFLTNMYTAGGYPQGNNTIIIEKGSTKLQVTITDVDPGSPTGLCSVDTSTAPGTEVTFTLDTPNTFTDLDDCIIRIPIKVSDIDISNKYFSVGADVTGQLAVGSQITIKHSTPNVDDRNFTVIDTAYVGTRTRIYVKEVIKSVDSDAEVSYRRTVPLLYQRANLGQFVFDFTSAINTDLRTYYSGNTNTALVWQTTLETLLPDRDRIIAGMTEAEITALENLYHLPKEAFQHLVDILEKNVKESAFDLTSQVTEAEYAEVFNILTLAFKNYLAPVWLSEEASINLYYTSFWHAFVDPVEGEVPLFNPEISALIDPSAAGDSALPEPRFGKTAIDIYNKRKEQVDNVTDLLRKVAANNFPGLINMVLGDGVSTTGLGVDLVQLLSDLNSIDAQRSATANSIVSNNFKLTAANFQALMQLRTRSGSNNPPSASEIESALAWLADVYCKRRLTGLWNAEEATVRAVIHNSSPPDYKLLDNWWLAKKAVLPKWRTSAESRSSWKQALAKKNLAPAIEPDLVLDTDIAIINGPVFDFWVNRREAVAIKIAAITAAVGLIPSGLTTSNDDKFNTGITNALNVINAAEFHNLETLKDKGEDIRRYLNHMRLSNGAYERLLRLKTLGYSTWLNEEKDEFYSILVQAWKEWKWYGVWNSEEQASSIIVSPDYFAIPTPEYAPNAMDFYTKIPKWRATWKARSAWEKKLKGREDQYGNVDDQVKTLIKNVEDSVLLSYQDALVNLIGDEMLTLEQNATNLSKRLLVDFNIRCCQTTTRLSQAIDTIQKLIWTESVGIDQKEIPAGGSILRFTLNANNFEDEWCWMGSYATWRAAMFVFMFPENLLIPTLRKWQSPAFRNLVSEVRGNDRLTPVAACHAAKKYSEYYEDVANLDPQCTCTAIAKTTGDDCVNGSIQNAWCTFFTFALSKKTKKAYFSTRNYMEQNTMSSFSYWAEIESLGKDITQLLGASVYENEVNRYIFLFATITEEFEEKLVFVKYDLDKGDWDDDFTGLDVPEETDFGKIKILQRNRATEPPKVLIHTTGTDEMLVNSLNKLGKKWDSNKWKEYFTTGRNKIRLKEVYAFIEVYHGTSNGVNYYNEVAIALPEDGKNYIYRAFGPSDNGKWEQATWGPGKFVGAVCLNIATKDIQIITRPSGSAMNINTVIRVGRLRNILQRANPTALIASFEDLDAYMIDVAGVGLRHLQFQNSGPTGGGQTYLQLIARLRLYIPAAQITTYPDQFTLPLDPTSNPSYANKANGQVTGWYTFLEAFQNFQMYYTRFRAFDQEYADKWRELCDNLLNFLVTTVFTGSQTDPWPRDHLVPALRQVMMNIGQQSPVFYTSTNNIVRKKLTLANVMHSLLNFTFDENGEIRNSPDDENYPKPYVTILGVRIDGGLDAVPDSSLYIARPGKNVTRICPNWGMQPMTAKKMADTYNYYAYTIEETINEDYFTGTLSINYAARAIVKNDPTAPFFKYMDLNGTSAYHLNPFVSAYYEITEDLTSAQLQLRKTVIDYLYLKNTQADYPVIHREYLREAYYFIPFYLGQQLSQRGHYQEALEWFKTVYDYTTEGEANRRLYNAVQMDSPNFDATPDRAADWLLDPLNPHALAATRENAYYKYTLYTIAQTFSAWADAQFTLDTVETVSQAGSLYQVAEDLLSLDVLKQLPAPCTTNIFDALTQLFCEHPELKPFRNLIERIIAGIPTGESFEVNEAIEDVLEILTTGPGDVYQRLKDAEDYVEDLQDEAAGVISISVSTGNAWNVATQMGALSIGGISGAVTSISSTISTGIMHGAVVQYG